jgi:single-strand DNA-binding protein
MGNLGADPETRYTPNGAINVQFSIAVSPFRRQSDTEDPKPTWYRVTAWDRNAEIIDRLVSQGHIVKGRPLYVEGKLEPRQFTGNDGQVRTSMDVTMTAWEFVGSREDQPRDQSQGAGGYNQDQGQQNRGQQDRGAQDYGTQAGNSLDDDRGPSNIDDVPF